MVNRNLIRELDLGDELEQEIDLQWAEVMPPILMLPGSLSCNHSVVKERFYELTMNSFLLMLGTRVKAISHETNGMKQNPPQKLGMLSRFFSRTLKRILLMSTEAS
jgi:hypothetical protein